MSGKALFSSLPFGGNARTGGFNRRQRALTLMLCAPPGGAAMCYSDLIGAAAGFAGTATGAFMLAGSRLPRLSKSM